jgi:3-oxoacyl-[acyl-carrier-protein] synthase II
VLAANGIGKDAFWGSILACESGIGPITLFDASEIPCKIAGEVKNFDPLDFMDSSMKPRRMGRFSQLGIAATVMALEDSGLSKSFIQELEHLKIVLGVATSDIDLVVDPPKIYSTPSLVPHAAATAISRLLGNQCELITLSNACTSGLDAIARAAELIRSGKTEVAIAGSAEGSITYTTLQSLSKGGMLPTEFNDTPEEASCPFSYHRKGGILSEGAAIVVLESLDHALERGARIYAETLGFGSWIHPNQREDGNALQCAMQSAIDNSGIATSDIGYINAHAPSDPILDQVETDSIKSLFAERAYSIPTSSIKGATGNPFACGGSLQCVATSLALHNSLLPPTTNYSLSDPYCDLDYIPTTPRSSHATYAMINSRGIGGGNSSLILKKAESTMHKEGA